MAVAKLHSALSDKNGPKSHHIPFFLIKKLTVVLYNK